MYISRCTHNTLNKQVLQRLAQKKEEAKHQSNGPSRLFMEGITFNPIVLLLIVRIEGIEGTDRPLLRLLGLQWPWSGRRELLRSKRHILRGKRDILLHTCLPIRPLIEGVARFEGSPLVLLSLLGVVAVHTHKTSCSRRGSSSTYTQDLLLHTCLPEA